LSKCLDKSSKKPLQFVFSIADRQQRHWITAISVLAELVVIDRTLRDLLKDTSIMIRFFARGDGSGGAALGSRDFELSARSEPKRAHPIILNS
jgi:hypothetical protein